MKNKELKKFVATGAVNNSNFYTKEFDSNTGTVFYIHYYDATNAGTVHESFVYDDAESRDADFKLISEKVA